MARYFDDRIDKFKVKFKTAETMLFSCSPDGEKVDFGVGYGEYTRGASPPEKFSGAFDMHSIWTSTGRRAKFRR